MKDLSLILPVHNQADIIEPVFKDIIGAFRKLTPTFEIILVENGSTDKTLSAVRTIARRYAHVSVRTAAKGYGSAILSGLKAASGRYVCYMPSDGQVDLSVLPSLWKLAARGRYQLVKVRRVTRESRVRQAVSLFFSAVMRLLFGVPFLDINGSPRIFLRKYVKLLRLTYRDSFIDAEFAVKANLLNWHIAEIPMRSLPRYGGKSTRSWKTFMEFLLNLYRFRTGTALPWWRRSVGLN